VITEEGLRERLAGAAGMMLRMKRELPAGEMEDRSVYIGLKKDWLSPQRPELFRAAKEWELAMKSLFPELRSIKVIRNGDEDNGHLHVKVVKHLPNVTDERTGLNGGGDKVIRELSIKIENGEENIDIARLVDLLNLAFAAGNIPKIGEDSGVADYNPVIDIVNEIYTTIIGKEEALIPAGYTKSDINGLAVIIIRDLPAIEKIDVDDAIELDALKAVLRAV
jgi:hypothetical protein